jgi:hypothetical protein
MLGLGQFFTLSKQAPGPALQKLGIHNLQEMGRLHSKLVSSGFEKHTSLYKQTHYLTMESLHYKSVKFS